MADTYLSTTDALAVKLWEAKTYAEVLQDSAFGVLFGSGAVTMPSEFKSQGFTGDEVTIAYVNQLTGGPVLEGQTARGNEESIDRGNFSMKIGENLKPIKVPGKYTMEQQRTKVLFENFGRDALKNYFVQLFDFSVFNQLAGYTGTSFTGGGYTYAGNELPVVLGHNSAVAPDSSRQLWAGTATNDQGLGSSDKFELKLIDRALERLHRDRYPIAELKSGGYQLWISPEQRYDLMHSTDTRTWYDIQRARKEAGEDWMVEDLKNRGGAWHVGRYQGVDIFCHGRVSYGVNASTSAPISTVRRAVLVGKDALFYGTPWGGGNPSGTADNLPVKYAEERLDYGRQLGICGQMIYGLKKPKPSNGVDLGTMVISTYAAAH